MSGKAFDAAIAVDIEKLDDSIFVPRDHHIQATVENNLVGLLLSHAFEILFLVLDQPLLGPSVGVVKNDIRGYISADKVCSVLTQPASGSGGVVVFRKQFLVFKNMSGFPRDFLLGISTAFNIVILSHGHP